MSATPSHPTLRLITGDVPRVQRPTILRNIRPPAEEGDGAFGSAPLTIAREQVRAENAAAAASMSALDPRWILAVQVSRELQGGRAAVITPEARRRLLSTGQRLGLRSFDSNLVVAMVQDSARSGEDPLGQDVVARLRLVHNPEEPELADAAPGGPTWSQVLALGILIATLSATTAVFLTLWWTQR